MFPILGRLHSRKRRSSGMGRRAGTPCYSETTKDQRCFKNELIYYLTVSNNTVNL